MHTRQPRARRRAMAALTIAVAVLLPLACSDDSASNDQSTSDGASRTDDSTPTNVEPVVEVGDPADYEPDLSPATPEERRRAEAAAREAMRRLHADDG